LESVTLSSYKVHVYVNVQYCIYEGPRFCYKEVHY